MYPSTRTLDTLEIARIGLDRSPTLIPPTRPGTAEYVVLYAPQAAVTVRRRDTANTLAPGDFLVAPNEPMVAAGADASAALLALRVPDETAGMYSQSFKSAIGNVVTQRDGTACLVAHLLDGIAAQPDGYVFERAERLAQHVVGLLGLMCQAVEPDSSAGSRASMLRLAQEHIESHLGDLDLTPDTIAVAQNVSTRTLHRLFEVEGTTIGGWIRNRRLENSRLELGDPRFEVYSVSAIGARWGLWDAAHFSRLFKARYGMGPRAYRMSQLRRLGAQTRTASQQPA